MPDQAEKQTITAFVTETFTPNHIDISEPEPGEEPVVLLQQMIGKAGPNTFLFAKVCRIDPNVAVQIGEALVEAGRSARSGLAKATLVDLKNIDKSKLGQTG